MSGKTRINPTVSTSTATAVCGDYIIESPELCDSSGWGDSCCYASCNGWRLGFYQQTTYNPPTGTFCEDYCCYVSDDCVLAVPIESCDDGNLIAGDGCTNNQIDAGYSCS